MCVCVRVCQRGEIDEAAQLCCVRCTSWPRTADPTSMILNLRREAEAIHTCTGTGQPPVNERERERERERGREREGERERGICSVLSSVCFCTRTFSGFKSQCTCRAVHTQQSGLSVWGTAEGAAMGTARTMLFWCMNARADNSCTDRVRRVSRVKYAPWPSGEVSRR